MPVARPCNWNDGHTLHVRKATRPEGQHLEICQVLGIEVQPGGVRKFIH